MLSWIDEQGHCHVYFDLSIVLFIVVPTPFQCKRKQEEGYCDYLQYFHFRACTKQSACYKNKLENPTVKKQKSKAIIYDL